jgi:hypothetical protein
MEQAARGVEIHNAQQESWVKLFLAVVSGAITIAAIAFRSDVGSDTLTSNPWAIPIALGLLLIYGLVTLHSMSWRERYKAAQHAHRRILQQHIARLQPDLGTIFDDVDALEARLQRGGWFRKTIRGSVREFVYLTNFFLAFALLMVIPCFQACAMECRILIAAMGSFVLLCTQYKYSRWVATISKNNTAD